MAEHSEEGGGPKESEEPEAAFSFMDKVRFMMYGEQEKEAFLIEKKEKEEKKKAKKLETNKKDDDGRKKKTGVFGKIKAFVSGPEGQSPDEDKSVSGVCADTAESVKKNGDDDEKPEVSS